MVSVGVAVIMPTMLTWRAGIIAGVIMAVCYSASPLFTLTLAGSALLLLISGNGLHPHERRLLAVLLGSALAVRFLFIGVMLVTDIPLLNDLSVGGLRGDDAYYLSRAIRARDITLGLTQGRYDFFVITDEYGRTSYLHLLTALQVLFGPTPYGMRAVNALLFVAAGVILFRLVRPGFGATASFAALVVLLFLPSLFVSSVSLLKESVYFLVASVLLLLVTVARRSKVATAIGCVAGAAVCVFVLHDLRRGALELVIAGVAIGLALPVVFATRRRALASIAALSVAIAVAAIQPPLRARALDAVTAVARTHAGHVYTSGHAYKLLDDGFYETTAWPERLTDAQALRFLVRAAVSFVVTPLPWEMVSLSELSFFPELVGWWLIVIFAPIGIIAGWQRDRHITALLLGFALPTAAALAVTNGNVGTLLRLRGLVTPYIVWLAVLGALAVAEYFMRATPAPALAAEQGR
jgi:hypothetical protein